MSPSLTELSQFVGYGKGVPDNFIIGKNFLISQKESVLLVYPTSTSCDYQVIPEDAWDDCQNDLEKLNVIGSIEINSSSYEILTFSLTEVDSKPECTSLLFVTAKVYEGGFETKTFVSCLAHYITLYYRNDSSAAWGLTFRNSFSAETTYILILKEHFPILLYFLCVFFLFVSFWPLFVYSEEFSAEERAKAMKQSRLLQMPKLIPIGDYQSNRHLKTHLFN